MSRISYVNGRYVPHFQAKVHIEDRGFQFSDAVYEGFEVHNGRIVDLERHMTRLKRSLSELKISQPSALTALRFIFRELIRRNHICDGFAYLQISRGTAPRNHAFPAHEVSPTLVATVRAVNKEQKQKLLDEGVSVITTPENRWPRVDIKTVSLLPNILAKQAAAEAGAYEAWFVDDDGYVTEGSSSNAWIVDKEGHIRTHSLNGDILAGITRQVVMEVAGALNISVLENKFTVSEALEANESFNTSASSVVMPVIKLNNNLIADGKVGPVVRALQDSFRAHTSE